MGIYRNGILGPFSGTVGSVVGSSFRGESVMRSRPRKSNRVASELQKVQRSKFAKTIQFLTPAKSVISEFYGVPSGVKSRFNLATSYHIQDAVEYVNDKSIILYDKVVYAKGNLLSPQNLVCDAVADAKLKLTWSDNSAQAGTKTTDALMVVVLDTQTNEYEFFLNVAKRDELQVDLGLPAYLTGVEIQVYAFMASADGKSNSTSQHLGKFTVL